MNKNCLSEKEAFYQFSVSLYMILFLYFLLMSNISIMQTEIEELKALHTDINKTVYEIKEGYIKND
jgi:hypothetical protein